ncbi:MFS transporter [Herpetosiphon giganteus]|uniref:MFS transporter n=1 Tax=Herpetosiphon giganteus TaxID=2029754 RepID=UPI00195B566C|nr:MFS transporter [Herpetosiphon giganteus]MBM7845464.1 DHA3 family macrolide efflux protein-like MFS transporter [Herpetosiphon giganteus]
MSIDSLTSNNPTEDWSHINWKPRFFAVWLGQASSLVGSALTQFVLIWWITQTVGSAQSLAIAGMMALLPQAVFGPIGGIIADRWNRRFIMISSDLISALSMVVLIVLFATDQIQLWHIYTLMFLRSTMQAFQSPAATASTSQLVPADWLTRAAGMNQMIYGLMSVAAAPLGALAMSVFSLEGALMIDVVTALLAITPLLFYKIPQTMQTSEEQVSMWQDFRSGLAMVMSNRGLVLLYGVTLLMVAVLIPGFVLTPLLIQQEFGGGVERVALMEGVGGLGMIIGGVMISLIQFPMRRIVLVLVMFALSSAMVGFTGMVPGPLFWIAVVLWFISGVTYTIGNAPIIAIIQTIVPNQLQGRVLSLYSTMIGLAGPIALIFVGPLSELIGIRMIFIAGGFLATLVCMLGFLSPNILRIEQKPVQVEQH